MSNHSINKNRNEPSNRGFGGRRSGPMAMMKGDKAKNFKGTMKRLISYMNQYKLKISIVFLFAVSSTVFTIIGPKILGKATTKLYEGVMLSITGAGSVNFEYIAKIVVFVTAIYIISSAFAYIMGWIMSKVSTDITYRFRKDISHKINKIPLAYFDKTTHGEILSRITNDVDTISQTLSQSLTQIITSLVSVIGVLIMMFSISWQMTLVSLLILPVSMIFVGVIIRQSQKHFKTQQEYLGHINGHVEEMFSGHMLMKGLVTSLRRH